MACTSKTADSLTLSWDKVNKTEFYRLYSFNPSTKKYTRLAQTTACSFTLKGLKSGTDYILLVRAFASSVSASDYSEDDHLKVRTLPGKPDFSLKSYSYSVKLSWKKVTGAEFYRVYSFDKTSGKYTKLVETKDRAWEHLSLKGNTEYTYIVRAFHTTSEGSAFTKADNKSIKTLLRKPKFSLKAKTETEIDISWSKIPGAAYYRVYLYNSKTGKYTRLAQTTALKYTYTKASLGKEFVFLVRAFDSSGVGSSYSTANNQSISPNIEEPDFSLKAADGSVKISWNKVALSSYYRVYSFDAESGKYTRIAQTGNLSFTVSSLESGREYTFLVRAFSSSGAGSPFTDKDNKSIEIS